MIRIVRATFALLLLTTAADASPLEWNPPARFDGTFKGKVIKRGVSPLNVTKECNKEAVRRNWSLLSGENYGCAYPVSPKLCIIIFHNKDMRTTHGRLVTTESTVRHEMGHCAGWGPNHPS